MKKAVYIAIIIYFFRKVMRRILPVDSSAPWMVLWLLRYDDEPGPRDRYIRVYEGPSALAAEWTRSTMIRQEWVSDCIVLCRKGQQRDIRILDLQEDLREIYDLMDSECADELLEIYEDARYM